ncbi:uncharacterized protein LOC126843025 [Adelges cooleyi]|uniref:uncharacterized protein LOC126843025 n=1 Tax=Adelges cooleyi TaxID=133065 RepID=UPI0021802E17|nr:uncharacterized protein LOC126843025 [Adelges cooleyi]
MKRLCLYALCLYLVVSLYGETILCLTETNALELAAMDSTVTVVDQAGSDLSVGRGKKKMKKKTLNMMIGATMMVGMALMSMFINATAAVIGKALLFTLVAKLLVVSNWKNSEDSGSSKKESSHKDLTLIVNGKGNRSSKHFF